MDVGAGEHLQSRMPSGSSKKKPARSTRSRCGGRSRRGRAAGRSRAPAPPPRARPRRQGAPEGDYQGMLWPAIGASTLPSSSSITTSPMLVRHIPRPDWMRRRSLRWTGPATMHHRTSTKLKMVISASCGTSTASIRSATTTVTSLIFADSRPTNTKEKLPDWRPMASPFMPKF